MRKILVLLISAILCASLAACNGDPNASTSDTNTENTDGQTTEANNDIELTMDNYKKYLDISNISIQNSGEYYQVKYFDDDDVYYIDGYDEIRFEASVEGASPNFIYNDVYVTVRFSGKYDAFDFVVFDASDIIFDEAFDFDITVEANVAGNGSDLYIIDIGGWGSTGGSFFSNRDFFEVSAEVVNITGSVTPVK